ncbi:MAG: hypothetical protein MUF07_10335 [Steroidobacteraceae bacterium]|jgi:hypothetical protein|nr:hypothetical protein [Steroidobacteraceae bacterium]
MRVVLTLLVLLALNATNLAVAADVHADPAQVAAFGGVPPAVDAAGDDPSGSPCQICLHGPALTLLPQALALPPALQAAPPSVATPCPTPPAAPPGRIDEPPRPVSG